MDSVEVILLKTGLFKVRCVSVCVSQGREEEGVGEGGGCMDVGEVAVGRTCFD